MEKLAGVYVFKEKIVLISNSQLKMGIWFTNESHIKLAINCSDTEIVTALNTILEASKQGVDNISNIKDINKAFLKNLGVKSFKELHEKTHYFSVFSNEDFLIWELAANLGSKKGFALISNATIKINQKSIISVIAATFNLAVQTVCAARE